MFLVLTGKERECTHGLTGLSTWECGKTALHTAWALHTSLPVKSMQGNGTWDGSERSHTRWGIMLRRDGHGCHQFKDPEVVYLGEMRDGIPFGQGRLDGRFKQYSLGTWVAGALHGYGMRLTTTPIIENKVLKMFTNALPRAEKYEVGYFSNGDFLGPNPPAQLDLSSPAAATLPRADAEIDPTDMSWANSLSGAGKKAKEREAREKREEERKRKMQEAKERRALKEIEERMQREQVQSDFDSTAVDKVLEEAELLSVAAEIKADRIKTRYQGRSFQIHLQDRRERRMRNLRTET